MSMSVQGKTAIVTGAARGIGLAIAQHLVERGANVMFADSDEEAMQLWAESAAYVGANWFAPFGFSKGLVDAETGETADLWKDGLALVGTVDTVTRQLEGLLARLPARWLFAWTYNAFIPHAVLMNSIEKFQTKVLPRISNDG